MELNEFGADLYKPKSYLYITVVVALSIIACLIVAGFNGLPIWWVVAIGAAVQTVFRLLKKLYLRLINYAEEELDSLDEKQSDTDDNESGLFAFIPMIAIYLLMLPISALWYGVGAGIKWLIN